MIQANELRIGNWVNHILDEIPIQIRGISKSDKSYGGNYYVEWLESNKTVIHLDITDPEDYYISGIPLTPEILEKAGFEKRFDVFFKHERCNYIFIEDVYNIMIGSIHETGNQCITMVSNLHELQNAFFALTGHELEIKL